MKIKIEVDITKNKLSKEEERTFFDISGMLYLRNKKNKNKKTGKTEKKNHSFNQKVELKYKKNQDGMERML